ncbi:MAG: 30S ribosomal protein S1 [Candidatus Komeilibacteria bacterium CG11_big_fil_rev_8_21_14_0_20_36_20]|uniref:30S ribosomal protein S1 n=1 Tax=Candidatus Komeilibacteria bacterium CG11_big_fil_rev_8_21_14_0_20_36_20 TaxID=1974477 RepID=A0A2H0NF52_9BACT|nr:MAG: 30S ribosomal protein S1 [Candidatus Komeilibacteria bacterium CG11_big_fil_rev_8_21_14_0_20_36_20]PIR81831.1 MAG: 30S ribosomal protein S1 [Candidatus Komeilibacteria bacterium CG10_big_fil_rev_8_21_14_0_10_36_65]PJC55321.1 MAG: 30S ribosomal protein S1 [Candidatus Komeilibacteria bacterium CG_4_9_14_0_2_um_filter_36_13]
MSNQTTSQSLMDKLLQKDEAIKIPKVGDLVSGTIISVSKNEIYLDLAGITTGIIRGQEIYDESDESSNLKIGDKTLATVIGLDNENGYMELSFREAGHKKAWDNLEKLYKEGTIIESKVIDANKGGLMIKLGNVIGFLPVSQLTIEHYPRIEGGDKNKILAHLKSFVNEALRTKIIDVNEKEEKLIVSEKAAWDDKQKKIISKYKIGDKIKGRITGVVDFGAFVEFGDNLEGLVHISELAWQRIDNPRDIIKVGDVVEAIIIDIQNTKVSLSIKKLQKDPWVEVAKKYKIGQKVKGSVLKVNPFGAFVELDDDIHGLVHISELSDKKVNDPENIVKIGKEYNFTILSIEPENHRLGLSLKEIKTDKDKKDEKKPVEKKKEKTEKKDTKKSPTVSPSKDINKEEDAKTKKAN